MDWAQIRAHYGRLVKNSDLTQEEIAAAGGLKGQNAVSKLIHNTREGPTVGTFVRAVLGLGMSLSTFFGQLEAEERPGDRSDLTAVAGSYSKRTVIAPSPSPQDRTDLFFAMQDTAKLTRAIAAFFRELARADPPPRRRRRGPRRRS